MHGALAAAMAMAIGPTAAQKVFGTNLHRLGDQHPRGASSSGLGGRGRRLCLHYAGDIAIRGPS